jgi:hypothetical protein
MIRTKLVFLVATLCVVAGVGQQEVGHPAASKSGASDTQAAVSRRTGFVGDSSCLSCHRERALSYFHTAHYLTSQAGNRDAILGSFQRWANVLMISDPAKAEDRPGLFFKMEARRDGYYETAVSGLPGLLQQRSERIDVVIGSGVRGQSYLYWQGDQLYELPVSYWSDGKQWINSPGYANGTMNFSRPVTPRCLECHATYVQARTTNPLANSFYKNTLIPGISCETCHGPGADHVAQHQGKSPASISGKAILNPAKFSRDRQVDLCALCHNGIRQQEIAPAFSFVPGQALDNYVVPEPDNTDTQPNVHGDQVGLLKKSRCYQSSPNMGCSTCHDVHAKEMPAASYSVRCLSCHRAESCGMFKTIGAKITNNCINCHMPIQSTNAIISETAGQSIRPKMRTHWIKIYP